MSSRHVISRLTVEVPATQVADGQARQREIGAWLRADGLWHDISNTFDHLVPSDQVLTISRLEITVEVGSELAFQRQLRQAITRAVEQVLQTRDPLIKPLQSRHERVAELARYFLETGQLPAHTLPDERPAVTAFLDGLADEIDEPFGQFLRQIARTRPVVWLRLFYAIGPDRLRRLVLLYGHFPLADAVWLTEFSQAVRQTRGPECQAKIWFLVLINSALSIENGASFRQHIQQIANVLSDPSAPITSFPDDWVATETEPTNEPRELESRNEPMLVQNAGLVLLWPFLSMLFDRLNLLDGTDFCDHAARLKAIHVLQYLVTGQTEPPEYDLTLNKILCHLPLHQPVPRQISLTDNELSEADALLDSAISHWPVLKNTSRAGLRETFLQREGHLTPREEGGWQLRVERKTVDILLDRLPAGWGYSVVQLPWMPALLFVEW